MEKKRKYRDNDIQIPRVGGDIYQDYLNGVSRVTKTNR